MEVIEQSITYFCKKSNSFFKFTILVYSNINIFKQIFFNSIRIITK